MGDTLMHGRAVLEFTVRYPYCRHGWKGTLWAYLLSFVHCPKGAPPRRSTNASVAYRTKEIGAGQVNHVRRTFEAHTPPPAAFFFAWLDKTTASTLLKYKDHCLHL